METVWRPSLITSIQQNWDAIVIGAGPAGSVSALRLARAGWRVLLLERCAWPRQKVCGGCVNADAIRMLHSVGVTLPDAPSLNRCVIRAHDQNVNIPLTGGVAIEREKLDVHLVAVARSAGVTFVDRASAKVSDLVDGCRAVDVERDGIQRTLSARWVLACDGINGSSLANQSWAKWSIHSRSRIGAAITIRDDDLPTDAIHMHVGDGGYVGQVRIDSQTVHMAAAIDPQACRDAGSPGRWAAEMLNRPALAEQHWTGTGRLTRHRKQIAAPGVLTIGDACGYVEPFTGQGIAWAIGGAIEATTLLLEIDDAATVIYWKQRHAAAIGRGHRACHAVRISLRYPAISTAALTALAVWPSAWNQFNRLIA